MLGKGGNTFAYGGRMLQVFDQPSPYAGLLRHSLRAFFPAFAEVRVEATWNGPSDRSVTGLPFFGQMSAHGNVFLRFRLFRQRGRAVSHGRADSRFDGPGPRQCLDPFAAGQRSFGLFSAGTDSATSCSLMVRNAIRRKERAEDHGRRPRHLDVRLAEVCGGSGQGGQGLIRPDG